MDLPPTGQQSPCDDSETCEGRRRYDDRPTDGCRVYPRIEQGMGVTAVDNRLNYDVAPAK